MADYTTIDNPGLFFNTVTYTGDMVDGDGTGHTQSITGVGFQPDWVWHKGRSNARTHIVVDSVRGLTNYKWLVTSGTGAELTTNTNGAIKSIDSDGITLENGTDSSSKANNAGANGETYVFWNWLAGNSTSSNSNGDLTSTVSVNQTAGFSICQWTSADTGAVKTVGHGLGVKPDWIVWKSTSRTVDWITFHKSTGKDKNAGWLNATSAASNQNYWGNTEPTSTVFSTEGATEDSGTNIAYCFAEKQGYSKFGSYTGNGNADGTFVYTGFKPAWVMIKNISTADPWLMLDNKRDTFNPMEKRLDANDNDAEATGTDYADFLSNGFKIIGNLGIHNNSNQNYIYMAFAEHPFVTSGTKAAGTAR